MKYKINIPWPVKEPTNSYKPVVIKLAAGTCACHYTINRGGLPTILKFTLIFK